MSSPPLYVSDLPLPGDILIGLWSMDSALRSSHNDQTMTRTGPDCNRSNRTFGPVTSPLGFAGPRSCTVAIIQETGQNQLGLVKTASSVGRCVGVVGARDRVNVVGARHCVGVVASRPHVGVVGERRRVVVSGVAVLRRCCGPASMSWRHRVSVGARCCVGVGTSRPHVGVVGAQPHRVGVVRAWCRIGVVVAPSVFET
ncbi:hypothetical protein EDB84DRAFT_1442618 [Lactarius hengduanensis]|nr:hypothetical protein EDB84DRAFT_1442618 [Lactarius hengduanensis]